MNGLRLVSLLSADVQEPSGPPDLAAAVASQLANRAHPAEVLVATPESSPPQASRRRRLWELPRVVFCPVLGTCVPIDRLRRLADKVLGQRALADDYELHCGAINACASRGELSERLQRELDTRHAAAIRNARALRSVEALAAYWREAIRGSEVGAALWVTLTHPCCDAALEEQVQRDIHMLQHQTGTGVRVDARRLQELVTENGVLTRELAAVQARVTRQMADKVATIERQQAELVRLRAQLVARDTRIACLREDLAVAEGSASAAQVRLDLGYRLEWQQQRLQSLAEALEGSQQQMQVLQRRLADAGQGCARVPETAVAGPTLDLQDKAVLCVGGRPASVPIYRQEIEVRGARFLHHDGGEEDSAARLEAHLDAADLVICQTGCISHNAYWRVKTHCKRTGKRCVFVDRPSATGLLRGLASESVDRTDLAD
ncbi:DUF2325 domain-containing protein [Sphaerotilus sp.]|uniref:DUF2325 domain-containing protein n=1 Tax=Sphaerotilus sp. TaxID=2093942 RepID=UPI002ACE9A59|nr:DUF2325 domain-containing protein [Sphaerotilus sp.]MDZ7856382.1 DUF2325 domain-containing protein [Sphaerotilus sp.]